MKLGMWVQQKQGRVKPTMQMKGKVYANDDAGLEKEADVMGAKALQNAKDTNRTGLKSKPLSNTDKFVQRVPKVVEITWAFTHVVRELNQSIFGGEDFEEGEIGSEGELNAGQRLIINDQDIIMSRRGPNQEGLENRKQNKVGKQINEWYRILFLNNKDVSSQNIFVRGGTFTAYTKSLDLTNKEDKILSNAQKEYAKADQLQKEALSVLSQIEGKTLIDKINTWLKGVKKRENMDTFEIAFKANRMTARQINLAGRGGSFQVSKFGQRPNPEKDRTMKLARDVPGILDRMNPENFYNRETGESKKK